MLTDEVYSNNPCTEGDLKESIQECTVFSITSRIRRAIDDVFVRCDECLPAGRKYFRLLLDVLRINAYHQLQYVELKRVYSVSTADWNSDDSRAACRLAKLSVT